MSVREEGASVEGARLLYSVEEAAQLLGIGRTFMFGLVAAGHVDSLKIGKRRKISRRALDEYIARLVSDQVPGANAAGGTASSSPGK
jgi:excisionase family DNA binding protein